MLTYAYGVCMPCTRNCMCRSMLRGIKNVVFPLSYTFHFFSVPCLSLSFLFPHSERSLTLSMKTNNFDSAIFVDNLLETNARALYLWRHFWQVFFVCSSIEQRMWGCGCHCFWKGERKWCIWVTLNDTGLFVTVCARAWIICAFRFTFIVAVSLGTHKQNQPSDIWSTAEIYYTFAIIRLIETWISCFFAPPPYTRIDKFL